MDFLPIFKIFSPAALQVFVPAFSRLRPAYLRALQLRGEGQITLEDLQQSAMNRRWVKDEDSDSDDEEEAPTVTSMYRMTSVEVPGAEISRHRSAPD